MTNIIEWFVTHENVFVWISLVLNVCSTIVFILAEKPGKVVYFGGAPLITVGVLMMR